MNFNSKFLNGIAFIILAFIITSCEKKEEENDNPQPAVLEAQKDIIASVEYLGVCYGPYHHDGQAPGTMISKSQLETDLGMIAKHFDFLRTYTVADGLDQVVPIAAANGLEVALGVHCYPNDAASTKADIDKAVQQAKAHPGTLMALVIGNETNLHGPNHVPPATVADYMKYAKQKLDELGLVEPVTSCITGVGADHINTYGDQDYCGPILQQCKDLNKPDQRVVLLTIYPYYGNGQPDQIGGNMQWSYNHGMSNAENNFGLGVIIGEIGWPTGANNNGTQTARENVSYCETNFKTTLNWVNGNNFKNQAYNSFWFEMFDEPWKTQEPNGIGPSWGIYAKNGSQTPKFPIPDLHSGK